MSWTTPRTWVAGEVVTAAIMNTHIRDNLNTLGPTVTGVIPASGTTPTSGTGFTYTHTNGSGIYVFTLSPNFAATPIVVASAVTNTIVCDVAGAATTGFSINCFVSNTTALQDSAFSFFVSAVH